MADILGSEQPHQPTKKSKLRGKSKKKMLLWLLILVLIAGAAWFVYDYTQLKKERDKLSDPQAAAQEATQQLVNEVGAIVVLPEGETPTVATVSDVSKLQNQAFFAKAENGDKVLIFTEAKRAILYRPSTGKVIEVAPINLGDANSQNQDNGGSQDNSQGSSNP
jgi:cytoskeletal protein RodZ